MEEGNNRIQHKNDFCLKNIYIKCSNVLMHNQKVFCMILDLSEEDTNDNIEYDYDGSSDSESGM